MVNRVVRTASTASHALNLRATTLLTRTSCLADLAMTFLRGAHLAIVLAMSALPHLAVAQSFSCANVAERTNLRTVTVPASTAGLDSTGLIFCYQLDSSHAAVRSAVSDARLR